MKKRFLPLWLILALGPVANAQQINSNVAALARSAEAQALTMPIGVVANVLSLHTDNWSCPYLDEEGTYLDAIGRGALSSPDAETKLLTFIEHYPHSAYLPFAQMRLGEWYFVRENWRSAAHWFKQYDVDLLPETMAISSDYYLAFALMRDGRPQEALVRFRPLTVTHEYGKDATFYSGYILMQQGKIEEGARYLRSMMNDEQYGPYASAYVAEGLLSGKRYTEALAVVQKLESRSDLPIAVRSGLQRVGGLASSGLGRREDAVNYLTLYVRNTPNSGRLELMTLGKELFELGRYGEAIDYLHRASGTESDFMAQLALYYEGLALLSQKQVDPAISAFDRAVAINNYPKLTQAATFNGALAVYSRTPGRLGEGTVRLEHYITQYPNGDYRAKAIGHLQDAYLNDPDVSKALAAIDRLSPRPKELVATREKVRLRKANTMLGKGNTAEAYREYDDIIRTNQDAGSVAEAYLWKGEVASRNGDYSEAINATKQYLALNPAGAVVNPNAYYNLGYAYFNTAQWDSASQNFREYISKKSDITPDEYTTVLNRLGDIQVMQRRYHDGIKFYEEAISKSGREADYAYFKKGMTLGLLKDYSGKAEYLGRMSGRFPNSKYLPEAIYEQGHALALNNDHSAARIALRHVFEKYPTNAIAPKAGNLLALSYFNRHQLKDAAEIYEQVIRRYPKSDEAKSALQDLKSISIELNRVDEFRQLANDAGAGDIISTSETDSLTYLAAERLIGEGDAVKAREALDKYLASYPNGAFAQKALYSKALLLYNNKLYREAATELEGILPRIANDNKVTVDAFKLLADTYDRLNEPGRAAEAYLRLARSVTNSSEKGQFIVLASERAHKSSSIDFLQSLADEIESGLYVIDAGSKAKVYSDAADLMARNNRKADAITNARRILQLKDNGGHARANVIVALDLYDKGQVAQAQNLVKKVAEQGTTDVYWLARGFILLADTYADAGDKESARTYLESVKSSYNYPNDGIIKMINDRLARLK